MRRLKAKKASPQLMPLTVHCQCIFFLSFFFFFFSCFDARLKLRTHKYRRKNLVALHATRRHEASVQALQVLQVVVCWLVGCLTSQQHASVSQGRICSDNFTCCHTETEAADQTFCLTQSQYTDTGPISPGADPVTPGTWQGSHWSANF